VISKGHGQVVYPTIFDNEQITEENYLKLRYMQGIVRWNAMEVDKIVGSLHFVHWT